jgi:hypothetical protein
MKHILWLFALCLSAALLSAQNTGLQGQNLQGQLPRLAVMDFAVNAEAPRVRQDAVAIRNLVQSSLGATARYRIMARTEIDQLLQNQQIALSAVSSTENLAKLQLEKVDYIITGTVDAIGDDYSVTITIFDVVNGGIGHSAYELMGSGSRDIAGGVRALMEKFTAGLRSEGGTVVSAAAARQGRASAAADTETGIRVRSALAGTLYFQDEETAILWDNDEYLISITRPGVYTVRMIFGNGRESSRTIAIQGRGIVDAQFGTPPLVQNLRVGTVAADSVSLAWDSGGTGLSYKVYYHTVNNPQTSLVVDTVNGTWITLWNIASNTDYYFWISAVEDGVEGVRGAVLRVNIPYFIGDRGPAGGLVFYDKGNYSDGWRFLEAAPADLGDYYEWGAMEHDVSGTSYEIGTGKRNTQLIGDFLWQIGESNRAAQICTAYRGGGYSDWFLPSLDELDLMYRNLKLRGLGEFSDDFYWSSSQGDYAYSGIQLFGTGTQGGDHKNTTYSVRCVRAF